MNFSLFTARRIAFSKHAGSSKVIVRIAIGAVAVSVAVMLVSIAVVKGYQHEIKSKITGFSTHIQLSRFDLNNSYETTALQTDSLLEQVVLQQEGVQHIQKFGVKAGIIKTGSEFQGIVLKGVDQHYDWKFIKDHLSSGEIPDFSTPSASGDMLMSAKSAARLALKPGDPVVVYFVQDPPRVRKFRLTGTFDTGFDEIDETYAFTDLRQVQKLNNWSTDAVTGYEIQLEQSAILSDVAYNLLGYIPFNMELLTIKDLHPQLFEWLGLLDLNVIVIIILMVIVACINMVTAILILIVERSFMIGILKTLGTTNRSLTAVFVYVSGYLVLTGMFLGNLLGLALTLSQKHWHWLQLPQEAYYLSSVPVELHLSDLVWVNAGCFFICVAIMLIPSRLVAGIQPARVLHFD